MTETYTFMRRGSPTPKKRKKKFIFICTEATRDTGKKTTVIDQVFSYKTIFLNIDHWLCLFEMLFILWVVTYAVTRMKNDLSYASLLTLLEHSPRNCAHIMFGFCKHSVLRSLNTIFSA